MGGSGKEGGADVTGGSGSYGGAYTGEDNGGYFTSGGPSNPNDYFYSNSPGSFYNVGFYGNPDQGFSEQTGLNLTTTPTGGGGGGGGGTSGYNWNNLLPIIGQITSAYGAYKSAAANEKNAAGGPVLPADVRAPRNALSDIFLKLLLTPGGLDYGSTPFNLDIGEGDDPFAAVNKYRTSSQPLYENELGKALDTERAKLGGQYGIRFGTDLQRGLGDTVNTANANREATLGQLGVSSYDSFMQRRLAELGLKTDDYRKQQYGLLPIVANYLSGQPSSSPYQGGSPGGQALQAFGGGLANAPLYQYLNNSMRQPRSVGSA